RRGADTRWKSTRGCTTNARGNGESSGPTERPPPRARAVPTTTNWMGSTVRRERLSAITFVLAQSFGSELFAEPTPSKVTLGPVQLLARHTGLEQRTCGARDGDDILSPSPTHLERYSGATGRRISRVPLPDGFRAIHCSMRRIERPEMSPLFAITGSADY